MQLHGFFLLATSLPLVAQAIQLDPALAASAHKVASTGGWLIRSTAAEAARIATVHRPVALAASTKFVTKDVPKASRAAVTWAHKEPVLAACAAVGSAGLATVAAPSLLAGPLLSAVGFGAGGVQSASLAATIQGTIGNVVGGSCFAMLQSAGAGGAGAVIVSGLAQIGGGIVALGSAGVGWAQLRARLQGDRDL